MMVAAIDRGECIPDLPVDVASVGIEVIPEPESRIMRYELTDFEAARL